MGIPFELVGGGYSVGQGGKKALENGRLFTTNMANVCRHLQSLLCDVYVAIYGGHPSDVEFFLYPTPRIAVGSVEDIVKLLDSGVVSETDANLLSKMLLGNDLSQYGGGFGSDKKMFVSHGNRKNAVAKPAGKPSAQ